MTQLSSVFEYLFINIKIIKNLTVFCFLFSYPSLMLEKIGVWSYQNQDYINIVMGTIVISHLFGTWVHLMIKKDFTLLQNLAGICLKVSVVTGVALLFEGFSHITIENELFYTYIRMTLRLLTLMYPLRSALLNCYIITKGAFPPAILISRFDRFQQTLDINDLKPKDKDDQ